MSQELKQLQRKFAFSRWHDRAIVTAAAALAGLGIVGFVHLTNWTTDAFRALRGYGTWLPLLATPLLGMAIVWATRRYASTAAGSGIPQVMAGLHPELTKNDIGRLISIRISVFKALFGAGAIGAGFAAGREGPSAQIAAGILHSCHRWLKHPSAIKPRDLILAGGAAGIAAAFNAPLAGIIFAIEELSRRFEQRTSGLLITAIMISGLVGVVMMGNFSYFGRAKVDTLPDHLVLSTLLVAILAGLAGGAFSRLMLFSLTDEQRPWSRWRIRHPVWFAGACGLAVAVLGLLSGGDAFGSGYAATRDLVADTGTVNPTYCAVKFLATWLSFWSGIPGGIFAPALSVGAGIGHDVALVTGTHPSAAIIALGMTAFLAAVTQAPITAFIIVMEMTDGHELILGMMLSAFIASGISRLLSPSLYHTLAIQQLGRLNPAFKHHHHAHEDEAAEEAEEAEERTSQPSSH